MLFKQSTLPKTPLFEKAWARLEKSAQNTCDKAYQNIVKETERMFAYRLSVLTGNARIDEAQKKLMIEQLLQDKTQRLQEEKMFVEQDLVKVMQLGLVKAEQQLTADPDHGKDLAVIALVIGTIVTPMDFVDIKNTFGSDIADTCSEILEFDAYPQKFANSDHALSDKTKIYKLTEKAVNLEMQLASLDNVAPGQARAFIMGDVKKDFTDAQPFLGASAQADRRFADAFNAIFNDKVKTGFKAKMVDGKVILDDTKATDNVVLYKPPKPEPKVNLNFPPVTVDKDGRLIGGKKPR